VGGAVTESIGALAVINSATGVAFAVGGSSTETVGAARIELIGGGKNEQIGASKLETVGAYVVNVSKSLAIDAKGAVALNLASQKQDISGGHSITAEAAGVVTASNVTLEASGKITLSCGAAEVVIDSSGVAIKGALGVTIEGTSEIRMNPPAILPG
jgi:type VI secretion system secreted protein VgrG